MYFENSNSPHIFNKGNFAPNPVGPLLVLCRQEFALAAKVFFPEGFLMRAEVQHFFPARRAARVDKPRKVEAAMAGIVLWGKSAGR